LVDEQSATAPRDIPRHPKGFLKMIFAFSINPKMNPIQPITANQVPLLL